MADDRDDFEAIGDEISEIVTVVFDNTVKYVQKLRKAGRKTEELADSLRALADMLDDIADLQHAAAIAIADMGGDIIKAERFPSDDDEDQIDDETDGDFDNE